MGLMSGNACCELSTHQLCDILVTFISIVQQVAGAVLIVACLLNTTPSFLEFLLCIPWRQLGELYPRQVQPNKLSLHIHAAHECSAPLLS